jgi:hypothetical protein
MTRSALDNRDIQSQPQSTLLRLPGEIRNLIHRYVASGPDEYYAYLVPLDPIKDSAGHCVLSEPAPVSDSRTDRSQNAIEWRPVNNLKYICRQLYMET